MYSVVRAMQWSNFKKPSSKPLAGLRAEKGIEVRIGEEKDASNQRYRCIASVSCACRSGLRTDKDCGESFYDDDKQLE